MNDELLNENITLDYTQFCDPNRRARKAKTSAQAHYYHEQHAPRRDKYVDRENARITRLTDLGIGLQYAYTRAELA